MFNLYILKTRKIHFFLFNLLLFINGIFADENTSIFRQNAIDYDSGYFHNNDDFILLGNFEINGKNIILANNIHYWGASTERATWRLLLFLDDGTFLGIYSGISFCPVEIIIEGQKVFFPFETRYGNVIDFSKEIPNEVWLDGHIYSYEKINDL
jgi:hypothetical protein